MRWVGEWLSASVFLLLLTVVPPAHADCGGEIPCGCGDTVIESILLDSDIGPCPGAGLVIGADSIVIDGGGHTLTGTGLGHGIVNEGFRHVVIQNCVIRDFYFGVYADHADTLLVRKNGFWSNIATAVWIDYGNGVVVDSNYMEGNGTQAVGQRIGGVANLRWTERSRITGNVGRTNGTFAPPRRKSGAYVSAEDFRTNYIGGVLLDGSSHNVIEWNDLDATGEDNIWLRLGSDSNSVAHNTLTNSAMDGVWIRESSGNTVAHNTISGINLYGIFVRTGHGNVIEQNQISQAGLVDFSGIGVGGVAVASSYNTIRGNEVIDSREGIRIHEASYGTNLEGNVCSGDRIGLFLGYSFPDSVTYVHDMEIQDSDSLDVFVGQYTNTTRLINVSFDPGKVVFDTTCNACVLHVGWYFDLLVQDSSGDPTAGAAVTLVDGMGDSVLQAVTGPDGRIPRGEVLEYTWTESGVTDRNDHVLHVRRGGYEPIDTVLAIHTNVDMTLSMPPLVDPTSVGEGEGAEATSLLVSPNPAKGAAVIRFRSPASSPVSLAVYDVRGRQVASLLDGGGPPEDGEVLWDGRDGGGRLLPAGIYFVRLRTAEGARAAKIVLRTP